MFLLCLLLQADAARLLPSTPQNHRAPVAEFLGPAVFCSWFGPGSQLERSVNTASLRAQNGFGSTLRRRIGFGMAALVTFQPDADPETIIETFRRDGAVIIAGLLNDELRTKVGDELEPWVVATPGGRDDFTGRLTSRTGALVARSESTRTMVTHPLILDLARRFLAPFTNKIQLHLTQVIRIGPDQGKQPLHRDRLAWGGYIPREIEPQFNTMWAMTDFTEDNGATRVVPGSVSWEDDRRATPDEQARAVMSAGSVLLYSGSVIHSGGENRTDQARTGINITYCLAWLRTEENQYLSCQIGRAHV